MSRRDNLDRHALRDYHPGGRVAEDEPSPVDALFNAAALLENYGSTSSECRKTADRLRVMARQLSRAQRAEAEARRADAELHFRRQR